MIDSISTPSKQQLRAFIYDLEHNCHDLKVKSNYIYEQSLSIYNIVENESPNFCKYIDNIVEIYKNLKNLYENSLHSFYRSINDLKDIFIRHKVYKRIRKERRSLRDAFSRSIRALESVNPEDPEKDIKMPELIEKRFQTSREYLNKCKEFYDYRKKFQKFYFNRFKNAFYLYGETITHLYIKESAIYNELSKLFKSIKIHSSEPEKILCKVNFQPINLNFNITENLKLDETSDSDYD